MKIDEIILESKTLNEGPIDFAKKVIGGVQGAQQGSAATAGQGAMQQAAGVWQGAKAGYSSVAGQQAGVEKGQKIGKMYVDQWNKAIGQNPAINTGANLQKFMQNSTKKSGITVPPPPAGELNPIVTSKYIIDVVSQSMAASALGIPGDSQDSASAPATTTAQQPDAQQPTAPKVPAQGYGSGTTVTPTNVTQQPSTVDTTQNADELIANAKPEELEAMLAALQGTPT